VRDRVAMSKNLKRPYLAISCFKKGQILKSEKRPNTGQISLKKMFKELNLNLEFHKMLRFVLNMP
jgi:hypothetical protein